MSNDENERVIAEIFTAAGRYIVGGGEFPKLSGDDEQVRAVRAATIASRRLYETMHSKDPSLDAIVTMLEEKNRAASDFKRVLGREWRF